MNYTTLPLPLERAPCGWFSTDDAGRLLALNASARAALGVERPVDGDGRPLLLASLLPPAARVIFATHLAPTLKLAGAVDEIHLSLRARDGTDLPVLLNAVRVLSVDGAVTEWTFLTIAARSSWESELLTARREAEQANRELAAAKARLEQTLAELQQSHWMLRKVAEVLPMCVRCGRVKSSDDGWESVAAFLRDHSGFLSHGCCPDCEAAWRQSLALDCRAVPSRG